MDQDLLAFIKAHGYSFTPDLSHVGVPKTVKNSTDKVWYLYRQVGDKFLFTFGDWRTQERFTYKNSSTDIDPEDPMWKEMQEAERELREQRQEDARLDALRIINESAQGLTTKYLEQKGLEPWATLFARISKADGDEWDLIVPMKDLNHKLWNVQIIQPTGFKSFLPGGRTSGLMFLLNYDPSVSYSHSKIFLCEGVATALSVFDLCTDGLVCITFSSHNLEVVAKQLREKLPDARIIICGDNDHLKSENYGLKAAVGAALAVGGEVVYPRFTVRDTGTDWNDLCRSIGVEAAKEEFQKQIDNPVDLKALEETQYGKAKKEKAKKRKPPTETQRDLADKSELPESGDTIEPLHQESQTPDTDGGGSLPREQSQKINRESAPDEGSEAEGGSAARGAGSGGAVRDSGKDLSSYKTHLQPYINGVVPMQLRRNKHGNIVLPTELEIAHYILTYYGDRICRYDETLFVYTGTHWKMLELNEIASLKTQIIAATSGLASSGKVSSILEMLTTICKSAPRNLFTLNAYAVSFKNGTLHIERPTPREFKLSFRPHNLKDYVTHHIPYNFNETEKNEKFEHMLGNIFGTDEEGERKLKVIQEMYGMCIAPIFPHLFLLYGPGGSGKTSVIQCAIRLVHDSCKSSVEPHEMDGFNLEPMAGKLVNYVTDIDVVKPISDAIIKRIEDRVPLKINRKYRTAVLAPLPATHIFGANDLPPTLERDSNAMLRRWSFIKMDSMDRSENPDFDFANIAFEHNPDGVVAWAIEGLKRICANWGRFSEFESDRFAVQDWQHGRSVSYQFVRHIKEGEIPELIFNPNARIERAKLWDIFKAWHVAEYSRPAVLGRSKFYKEVEQSSFHHLKKVCTPGSIDKKLVTTVRGVRFMRGIEFVAEKVGEGAGF